MNDVEVNLALLKPFQVLPVENKRAASIAVFQELPAGQEEWK